MKILIGTISVCLILIACNNYKERLQGGWIIVSINDQPYLNKSKKNMDKVDPQFEDLTFMDDKIIFKGPVLLAFKMNGNKVIGKNGSADGKTILEVIELTKTKLVVNSFLNGTYFKLGSSTKIVYERTY